jgi:hypothetical protein
VRISNWSRLFLSTWGGTVDGVLVRPGGQGDRPSHRGARALGGVHDFAGALIEQTVVEGTQTDADVVFHAHSIGTVTVHRRGALTAHVNPSQRQGQG